MGLQDFLKLKRDFLYVNNDDVKIFRLLTDVHFILPISTLIFSLMVGVFSYLSSIVASAIYWRGMWLFSIGFFVSLVLLMGFWVSWKKKIFPKNPKGSLTWKGRLFWVWFAMHNILWVFSFCLFISILLLLAAPKNNEYALNFEGSFLRGGTV